MLLTFFQLWLLGALSVVSRVHLTCSHHCVCVWLCFNTSLLSGSKRYSRLILYISCPSPRISYFPMESCFLLLEKGILKPRSRPFMSLLLGGFVSFRPSHLTEQRNICMYVYILIFIVSVHICNHLYLY